MNTTPPLPTTPETLTTTPAPQSASKAKAAPAAEVWQEFLEDDADCCGGCHHKPR